MSSEYKFEQSSFLSLHIFYDKHEAKIGNMFEMLIHEKRYEKFERTHIWNEGDPWKYIGFLLGQRNYFLATWTTYNEVCPAYH
jgi:hypothetical protein